MGTGRSTGAAPAALPTRECSHTPTCPAATEPGRLAAVIIGADPERRWWLLCNGLVVFDDTGYLVTLGRSDLTRRNAA